MSKILVTGAAGFIGFHLSKFLLDRGDTVVGLDNISGYYDISLKLGRLSELGIDQHQISEGTFANSNSYSKFSFVKADIKDKSVLEKIFITEGFDSVVNLAAQAGVRYSVENPQVYIDANIQGFINILELCRNYPVKHLVFASSSSVYGANTKMPFSINDNVDHPLSLYAATKKSNELMAHSYAHLFGIPTTGLRFFTVYGPWGRPDMALFLFADAIAQGKPIKIFNNGEMSRDFTYIDDIIRGVVYVIDSPPSQGENWNDENLKPGKSKAPYRLYNIGKNKPVKLLDFVKALEEEMGMTAQKQFLPMQAGDVISTYADVKELEEDFNYKPNTSIKDGIKAFITWYKGYFNIKNEKIKG